MEDKRYQVVPFEDGLGVIEVTSYPNDRAITYPYLGKNFKRGDMVWRSELLSIWQFKNSDNIWSTLTGAKTLQMDIMEIQAPARLAFKDGTTNPVDKELVLVPKIPNEDLPHAEELTLEELFTIAQKYSSSRSIYDSMLRDIIRKFHKNYIVIKR